VVFIVGDVTAKIGDPSGRSDERPALTDDDIARNLVTYRQQVTPFFDFGRAQFRHNGDWLREVTLPRLIDDLATPNFAPLAQRLEQGELPVIQLWKRDIVSVAIKLFVFFGVGHRHDAERQHLVEACQFELGKLEAPAVRERMLGVLAHVDRALATRVAQGLGLTVPAKLDGPPRARSGNGASAVIRVANGPKAIGGLP